jgi:hypothetical protein
MDSSVSGFRSIYIKATTSTGGAKWSFLRPPDQVPTSEILSRRLALLTACRYLDKRSQHFRPSRGLPDGSSRKPI